MGYIKQNFVPNQTLTAEELNYMDNQIAANETAIESVKESVRVSQTSKQDKLVSGTNIKTINGQSILGSGNITIEGNGTVDTSNLATKSELNAKQDKLVSGSNVKTINGQSILGSGNISITSGNGTVEKTSEAEIAAMGFTKNQGTVTAVKINGVTKNPSNGIVDLGTIEGGNGTVDLSEYAKKSELPTKTSELENDSKYTTESWVTGKIAEAQLGGEAGEVIIPVKGVQIDNKSIVNNDGIAIINSSEFKGEKGDKGDTGAQGDKGDTGETGPQGPKGEKGDRGNDGNSVTIKGSFASVMELATAYDYFLGNADTQPNPYFKGELTGGDGYLVEGDLWVYDGSEDPFADAWTNVGAIKGEDGESLFKSTVFTRSNGTPAIPSGGSWIKPVPEGNIWTDYIPDGKAILWATTCIFSNLGTEHGGWTTPVQMTDTADFEVIYSSMDDPKEPTDGFSKDENGNYNTEWVENNKDWTDDGNANSIWMATIKASNGVWGSWKVSKIKGEKGETKFMSTVFKRSQSKPAAPTTGNFDNPVPTSEGWYDGIPEGNGLLWTSHRMFSSISENTDANWSTPVRMTDTADFEAIYSSVENPTAPTNNFFRDADGGITNWLRQNNLTGIWADDGNANSIWMATIKASNGVWGNWSVTKIKGEKGVDGKDGQDGINGKDTEIAYLDNPMDSVLLNANGEATDGFPCTTNFYVYAGTQKAELKSVEYTVADAEENGLNAQFVLNSNNDCGTFTITKLAKTSNPKVSFTLKATTVDDRTYESVYLINKISASAPNIVVDLTNDNVNIPCDANKNILDGYNKISNGINVFEGATQLSIDAVEVLNNTTPVNVQFTTGTKSFIIPNLPAFDDVLDLTVNVTFKNIAGNTITRTTGFRVIKVVPGAAGEAAEFFELSPNFNTINVGRDTNGEQYIKNEEFIPTVMHVKGNSRVLFDATSAKLNEYGLILKYAVDADADKNSTTFPSDGALNLKNAITGDLDLDRYISLALIKNNEVIDFEKIYMIHDGAPGKDGATGPQGPQGEQGIQGPQGESGKTKYFHVAYSDSIDGSNMNHTGGKYIGTYVDEIERDSTNPNDYTWRAFVGEAGADGQNGQPGRDGSDGTTYYLHLAYAKSADGRDGFSTTHFDGATYLGTYVNEESNDPETYSLYTWTKITTPSYKLSASKNVIQKDNTGAIKDESQISIVVNKFDGSNGCENISSYIISDPIYDAYEMAFSIDGGNDVTITNTRQLSITKQGSDTVLFSNIEKFITYKLYYTQTGTANPILIDSVTINVVQDGANGVDGKMMYFDGEFDTTKKYVPTEKALPYVYDDSGVNADPSAPKYFYLRAASYGPSKTTPYTDYTSRHASDIHSWEPIESMDVLYSKIGLFETANVGPAVFYGDYVFSQTSIDGGNNFNDFDPNDIDGPDAKFTPATWFNFKTGQGSLANGNIKWTKNGNVSFGPNVTLNWQSVSGAPTIPTESRITEITNTAISTAEINADNIKSGTIDASKITVKNITVDRLDTAPNATGDKVKIDDNTVKVLNVDGYENVILSNNSIGSINSFDLINDFTSKEDWNQASKITWYTSGKYVNTCGACEEGTKIILKPKLENFANGENSRYFDIGYVNANGIITFNNIVQLFKTTSTSLLYTPNANDICYQCILTNNPGGAITPSTTYWYIGDPTIVMGGGGLTTPIRITVEKYDSNTAEWKTYRIINNPSSSFTYHNPADVIPGIIVKESAKSAGMVNKTNITVSDRGRYRAKVEFDVTSIKYSDTTVSEANYMKLESYFSVTRKFDGLNFSEFGRNGVIVKGADNIFTIDDNEITMSNASYGLKLNSSGFSRWDSANSKWVKLDLSRLDA